MLPLKGILAACHMSQLSLPTQCFLWELRGRTHPSECTLIASPACTACSVCASRVSWVMLNDVTRPDWHRLVFSFVTSISVQALPLNPALPLNHRPHCWRREQVVHHPSKVCQTQTWNNTWDLMDAGCHHMANADQVTRRLSTLAVALRFHHPRCSTFKMIIHHVTASHSDLSQTTPDARHSFLSLNIFVKSRAQQGPGRA